MVFPGTKVSETVDCDLTISVWKGDVPIPDAGFNFGAGRFRARGRQ